RATRFERAGMLEQFEFEDDGDGAESKVTAVGLKDWRPADVRADDFFRCSDAFSVDSCGRHGGLIPGAASEKTSQAEAGSCKKYSAPPLFRVALYLGSWLIVYMNLELAFAALSSPKRLRILDWLKNPRKHFPPQVYGDLVRDGVCGVFIAKKLRVSQPTASEHLKILQHAGLVRAKRIRQWTFYRRDEARLKRFRKAILDTF